MLGLLCADMGQVEQDDLVRQITLLDIRYYFVRRLFKAI
jgi:hypothetical protein